ncbi:MAG: hypothetical protein NVS1B7_1330 [Candidatus Saccharimonadales bacterium]
MQNPLKPEFKYETLTFDQRKGFHDSLSQTTVDDIASAGELFTRLDFDLARNPSQELEKVHLLPAQTERQEVDALATIAHPTLYPIIQDKLRRERAFMSAARLLLAEHHLFPVTGPHRNIHDVAVWSAAWSTGLDQESWQDQNGLIIGRGITTIGAFGMAASEVVQKIGHVFMSFPRTRVLDRLIADNAIFTPDELTRLFDTNNHVMRKEVRNWLGVDIGHRLTKHPNRTLHQAWEGAPPKVRYGDNQKPERIELQRVHTGITDILRLGYALPVVLWDGDDPVVELGELTKVSTVDDIKRVQEWHRSTLAQALSLPDEAVTIRT